MHPAADVAARSSTVGRGTGVVQTVFTDVAVVNWIVHGNFECRGTVVMAVFTVDCLYTKSLGIPCS